MIRYWVAGRTPADALETVAKTVLAMNSSGFTPPTASSSSGVCGEFQLADPVLALGSWPRTQTKEQLQEVSVKATGMRLFITTNLQLIEALRAYWALHSQDAAAVALRQVLEPEAVRRLRALAGKAGETHIEVRRAYLDKPQPTAEQWAASPHPRTAVPWHPHMPPLRVLLEALLGRASALAELDDFLLLDRLTLTSAQRAALQHYLGAHHWRPAVEQLRLLQGLAPAAYSVAASCIVWAAVLDQPADLYSALDVLWRVISGGCLGITSSLLPVLPGCL